ncbi:hypothetical protein NWF32_24245 [Pseudomonas qingdaonensis]|nr:hypothetical protein [Pseudomonas qingdaonensis]
MKAYSPLELTCGFSVLTLATVLGMAPAMADDAVVAPGKGAVTFEPIMITGEKLERDLKNTASSVSVKTARDIERQNTGNASVHEVLNDAPT